MTNRVVVDPRYVGDTLEEAKRKLLEDPAFRLEWESRATAAAIARRVQRLRTAAGLSQAELANRLGVSQPLIARLESEHPDRVPTFDTVARIAEACGRRLVVSFPRREGTGATEGQLLEIEGS